MINLLTQQFIEQHLSENVHDLALKTAPPGVDISMALQQISARQLLAKKVPSWAQNGQLRFPAHLTLEQCSSEETARYKASLVSGNKMVDLTGGLGVDCYFLAQQFRSVYYVDNNPDLVKIVKHNFAILNSTIAVYNADAEVFLSQLSFVDVIYIDPARRDIKGEKTVFIQDCTPDVSFLQETLLNKAQHVLIKLSPMLDISLALSTLNHVKEVHVVSVDNECKELLFLLERNYTDETTIYAVNLPQNNQVPFSFNIAQEKALTIDYSVEPQRYLYEPHAALLKAGAFKLIATKLQVKKLHVNSHLYTSEEIVDDFPGRTFRILHWAIFNKQVGKQLLSGITHSNITVRNFPLSVKELRKRLKLKDGGMYYLFATTLADNQKVLILCEKC